MRLVSCHIPVGSQPCIRTSAVAFSPNYCWQLTKNYVECAIILINHKKKENICAWVTICYKVHCIEDFEISNIFKNRTLCVRNKVNSMNSLASVFAAACIGNMLALTKAKYFHEQCLWQVLKWIRSFSNGFLFQVNWSLENVCSSSKYPT